MRTALALAVLILAGCGDNLPGECARGGAPPQVVIWHSPPVDCAAACGQYRAAVYPQGSGVVEPLCLFGGKDQGTP